MSPSAQLSSVQCPQQVSHDPVARFPPQSVRTEQSVAAQICLTSQAGHLSGKCAFQFAPCIWLIR